MKLPKNKFNLITYKNVYCTVKKNIVYTLKNIFPKLLTRINNHTCKKKAII